MKAAKVLLADQLQGQTLVIKRKWKSENRNHGPIPPLEKAEMLKTVLENPDITQREFAEKFDYTVNSHGAASGAAVRQLGILKQELASYQIPEKEDLLRADFQIIERSLQEQLRRLKEDPESMSVQDLRSIADTSFKRARLLEGKSTHNVHHDLDVNGLNEQELDAFFKDTYRIKVKSEKEIIDQ